MSICKFYDVDEGETEEITEIDDSDEPKLLTDIDMSVNYLLEDDSKICDIKKDSDTKTPEDIKIISNDTPFAFLYKNLSMITLYQLKIDDRRAILTFFLLEPDFYCSGPGMSNKRFTKINNIFGLIKNKIFNHFEKFDFDNKNICISYNKIIRDLFKLSSKVCKYTEKYDEIKAIKKLDKEADEKIYGPTPKHKYLGIGTYNHCNYNKHNYNKYNFNYHDDYKTVA